MAEPIMSLAAETLGNFVKEEAIFLLGVGDQVKKLHQDMKGLQAFLRDADTRQNESDTLREWISQTRDLAYQAEDLVEHYAFTIQSRKGKDVTSIIKRCVCLLDECLIRHQVGQDIESLIADIAVLDQRFRKHGIIESASSSNMQQRVRRTYSHVVEEDLVGIASQVETLTEQLIGENYKVVSIHGMGGLGKTTLARKVYHHRDVRRHFDGFSWVCVSQQWEKRDLLLGIAIKLMPEKQKSIKEWRDEQLVRETYELLQYKKCLIVIDDIWSTHAWDCIKDALPVGVKGSKVLLTTRNKHVAKYVDAFAYLHHPRFLTDDESWELLQRKFIVPRCSQDGYDVGQMEKVGRDMARHCGGLPLTILVLGGILANAQSFMEWENIHKNIKSYLGGKRSNNSEDLGLENIIEWSYNDLPYRLKPCFLYLSQYSEDAKIETESLCQIWMAEGLISTDDQIGDETMIDTAEYYLGELAERSMIFVELEELPSHRKFRKCRIHDTIRELCIRKAKEEHFLERIHCMDKKCMEVMDPSFQTRSHRLVTDIGYQRNDISYASLLKERANQHLRSFMWSSFERSNGEIRKTMRLVMDNFKMLRVLIIMVHGSLTILIPSAIHKLIHLRYLRIHAYPCLCVIPSSIGKLEHLQTLFVSRYLQYLPNVIWKLKWLKHLYLPKLPLGGKIRLNGLYKLEILENFDDAFSDVEVLSTFTNLRTLKASIRKKQENLEEFIKQVKKLNYLRFLSLTIYGRCDLHLEKGSTLLRDVLTLNGLCHLYIGCAMPRNKLPEYEPCFLRNLNELELHLTKMEEDPMRTLEKLPNLKTLSLQSESFVGKKLICHSTGFPKLKSLTLEKLKELNEWLIEEGAMPNIIYLTIYKCTKLEGIPSGLRFLSNVKELKIRKMPEEFKRRLQVGDDGGEGEDYDKVRHVPSIIFFDFDDLSIDEKLLELDQALKRKQCEETVSVMNQE